MSVTNTFKESVKLNHQKMFEVKVDNKNNASKGLANQTINFVVFE